MAFYCSVSAQTESGGRNKYISFFLFPALSGVARAVVTRGSFFLCMSFRLATWSHVTLHVIMIMITPVACHLTPGPVDMPVTRARARAVHFQVRSHQCPTASHGDCSARAGPHCHRPGHRGSRSGSSWGGVQVQVGGYMPSTLSVRALGKTLETKSGLCAGRVTSASRGRGGRGWKPPAMLSAP